MEKWVAIWDWEIACTTAISTDNVKWVRQIMGGGIGLDFRRCHLTLTFGA